RRLRRRAGEEVAAAAGADDVASVRIEDRHGGDGADLAGHGLYYRAASGVEASRVDHASEERLVGGNQRHPHALTLRAVVGKSAGREVWVVDIRVGNRVTDL